MGSGVSERIKWFFSVVFFLWGQEYQTRSSGFLMFFEADFWACGLVPDRVIRFLAGLGLDLWAGSDLRNERSETDVFGVTH